ncbi:uncharacterized protein BCR38DRAFT_335827 [Pseudomassariella vexata]|uniref:Oxidase ustYa n=1 Tax=Pseudomassariella vexata TaxID=1141098 RepID=A0A1Y2EA83_9PEZI|nr:uncharacterized protein BCR38DRAFT_335827 [Pseudomassariella vexata]ORY68483.1 hypothetical protein BCR38DRAFT_335827 [Pseudomassariella vexata]
MTSKQHKFENMALDDPDDRSSTEVEDSLMGREKQWQLEGLPRSAGNSRRTRICATLNSYRWMIDTFLLLLILGLVVRGQLRETPLSPFDFNGDLTGVGPRFSQQIKTFKPDYDFAPQNVSEFFTNETLDKWNEILPKGMGFQLVQEPEKYHDLPTPIIWDEGTTVFTTSVTHQLHCLWAIVQTYSGLKSNHTLPDDHHWHMIHCFSYLRQTIMCCADTAIEGLETTFPDHNGGSDGWDSKHVCKDYGQVKAYLESVRAYDAQEIF